MADKWYYPSFKLAPVSDLRADYQRLDFSLWLACLTEEELLSWRRQAREHYGEERLAATRLILERERGT
jgi:hypothetical protein